MGFIDQVINEVKCKDDKRQIEGKCHEQREKKK
jgi:hypothetical protein